MYSLAVLARVILSSVHSGSNYLYWLSGDVSFCSAVQPYPVDNCSCLGMALLALLFPESKDKDNE